MDDIEKEDVTDFAADLGNVTDNAWERILAFVNQVNLTAVDSDEDRAMARIYLAAHLAKMSSATGAAASAAGPVTSESAGGIRRSYGFVAQTSSSSLDLTRYGKQYLEILNHTMAHGPMVI